MATPKQKSPSKQASPASASLSEYFANDIINQFRLTGTIVAMDRRRSGATVITLQAGSLADSPVDGADGERLFTSRFLIRVPPRLKAKWPDHLLRKSPAIVTVVGRLHGVIEMIDGREYLLQELIAQDVKFIARFGTVSTHPMHWLKPFVESERTAEEKQANGIPSKDGGAIPQPSAEPADLAPKEH